MATFIGALILAILSCGAIYGFLTESKAAKRHDQDPGMPPSQPDILSQKADPGSNEP